MVFWELRGGLVGWEVERKLILKDKCHKNFALTPGTTNSPLHQTTCPLGAPAATAKLWPYPWQAAGGICWTIEPKPCLPGRQHCAGEGCSPRGRKMLPTEFEDPPGPRSCVLRGLGHYISSFICSFTHLLTQ